MFSTVGCQTPMAPTNHEIVETSWLEGRWAIKPPPEVEQSDATQDFRIELDIQKSKIRKANPLNTLLLGLKESKESTPPMYVAKARVYAEGQGKPHITSLNVQTIQTRKHLYVTYIASTHIWMDMWSLNMPIQSTARITRQGNRISFLVPKQQLVWTPMELAGEMPLDEAALAEKKGPVLVQSLDEALDFYDRTQPSYWTEAIIFEPISSGRSTEKK